MTFQVGDRVRYINNTPTGHIPALGKIGTVLGCKITQQGWITLEWLRVEFDEPCWHDGRTQTDFIRDFWKWELVSPAEETTTDPVLRKIASLTYRFKNKTLKTKKVTRIPFPQ